MKVVFIFISLVVIFVGKTNADLAGEVKTLKAEVDELKEFKASQTTYCSIHARGQCGPCICKDDFNLPEKYYCDCQNQPPKRDCLEFYLQGYRVNGIYQVTMNGFRITQVFCDQSSNGGGWTVIQRRMDGSTDFYRSWQEYKYGFGELQREFWLGNEYIHLMTAQAIYPKGSEALIQLAPISDPSHKTHYLHRYSHFQVDNEKSKYMLHVSGHSGGSSPNYFTSYNNNMPFSTFDRDNDGSSSYNCARDYNFGGWWYNGKANTCTTAQAAYTNFNGQYDRHKIVGTWYKIFNFRGVKLVKSEIKVRRLR